MWTGEVTRRCTRCGVIKPTDAFGVRVDDDGRERWLRSHCKTCSNEVGRALRRQRAVEHPKREMLAGARKRARLAGVPFDLREEDFIIPQTCPVLGIRLEMSTGRRGPRDMSPTLDRIVCSRGYVRENVIVVSWRANRLKSDATIDELARIVDWYRALVHQ